MADPWASVGAPVAGGGSNDWGSVGAPPPATAAPNPSPASAPAPVLSSKQDNGVWGLVGKVADRFAEIPKAAVEGQRQANEALKEDFTGPKSQTDWEKIGRVAKTTLDVAGYPFAAIGGAVHNVVGQPIEKAIGEGSVAGRLAGNTADAAVGVFGPEVAAGRFSAAGREAAAAKAARAAAQDWSTVGKPATAVAADKGAKVAVGEAKKAVYGDEPTPVKRLDNALFRAKNGVTADKLEVQKFLKSVPKEAKTPEAQEALYHELESKIADPNRELSPEAQQTLSHFEPYYKEQTDLVNDIRKMGAKKGVDVEPYLEDQGYVARRAVGHTPQMDQLTDSVDPITGGKGSQGPSGKSLTKTTTALRARANNVVLDDGKGNTVFKEKADPEEYKIGSTVAGPNGTRMTVRPATTREIEENTDTRYHKNAMVNTLDNVVRLRQVKRNVELLDNALKDMKEQGLAFRKEWTHRDEEGREILHRANGKEPEGFVELPHIPQLKGYSFAPEIAEVFKDYRPPADEPMWETLSKVNRALTSTLFWNPLPHAWNVANHWAVGRGWDWMTPGGYKSLVVNGAKAVHDVLTNSENYRDMLREGSALMYGDTQTKNFYDVMLQKGVNEITSDPQAVRQIAAAFKLDNLNPLKLTRAIYSNANKILWGANDIFVLQRQRELMDQGLTRRAAIEEAEKDIPNYRIPSRVMGSRALSQALRNPNLMLFGRYRYGQFRAWGSMFNDMYKGDPKQKLDAAGKFLVAALIAGGAYPMADALVQKVTGNDQARLRRGGGFSPVNAVKELSTGQKSWLGFMSTIYDAPPATRAAAEASTNRNAFGQKIVEPAAPLGEKVVEGAEEATGFVPPVQSALAVAGAADSEIGSREAARNLLVDLPTDKQKLNKAKGAEYDRRDARRRARKDPILRMMRGGQ